MREIRKLFTTLLVFFIVLSCEGKVTDKVLYSESFSFSNLEGVILSGILTIPQRYSSKDKIVVLVPPPIAVNRDYFGFYSLLADSLANAGFIVLRYDSRSFLDKKSADLGLSMFDQAGDANCAVSALQNDKRFSQSDIGLLGHSEAGCSVAIAATQNKNVRFVILLSTIGVSGSQIAYSQASKVVKKVGDRKMASLLDSSIKNRIRIIYTSNNIDTMSEKMRAFSLSLYKSHPELLQIQGYNQKSHELDSIAWLNPHMIAYIKFAPQQYYSKITCPILVICGDMDEKINYKENIEGLESIFKASSMDNYTIKIIKNLNHNYAQRFRSK